MKTLFLGLLSSLVFSFGAHGKAPSEHVEKTIQLESSLTAQPSSCLEGVFSSEGERRWKHITLRITNTCNEAVDLQNATITFQNKSNLETSFSGRFRPLSYPDNDLKITSKPDGNAFLSTLHLHFPDDDSKLPAGRSILIRYRERSEGFVQGTVKVYLDSVVETGSIILTNTSAKPVNVTQAYALVHVTTNGQKVTDIQLPWQGNKTVDGLAPATYTLSVDNVSDSVGSTYQGTVNPSTINLVADQDAQVTISYAKVQQAAKLGIQLQALPSDLAGYTGKPVVTVTQTGGGSSVSVNLNWNTTSTVTQLKSGTSYSFSTPSINYNGVQWNPIFTPATVTAKITSLPLTRLTYQRAAVIENTVTINVRGAPTSLSSLNVTLTPNNGTSAINTVVSLTNGSGSKSVSLPNGVAYTVSAAAVSGYSLSFAPQPLTSAPNATETITLSPIATGTPVAVNGQLKVIGTKLCNERNEPIQLRGMSTHGLQWYEECLTAASLDVLANDFKASVIRISLYVQEDGYETDPVGFTNLVNKLIKDASDRGIYALVDWHMLDPGDPNYNFDRARKFFTDIANANKGRKNLIYEIANEPNGVNWSTIKSYADRLIPIIRAIDPNTVILVGTVGWSSLGVSDGRTSQDIINAPVNFPNVMYTFHFYAASHGDEYLNELDRASNTLPIFVTEFGTQTYTGDGGNDFAMSDRYIDLMARKKISWTSWNFSDDFRSGAIWKEGTCPSGPWTDANLKPAGVYIKNKIRG